MGEEEMLDKFGFRQDVVLDLSLPSGEREVIQDYPMQFIDRNAMSKGLLEGGEEEQKVPQGLEEASADYECTLSDVVGYLKKAGYPLENCFISFFSPVFSAYINCGLDPLPTSIKITNEDLT